MGTDTPTLELDKTQAEQIKQFRDFLMSYNKLSELCFNDCVHDFTVRHVRDKEVAPTAMWNDMLPEDVDLDTCAMNCMEKYLKMNQRISQRFQDFQMQQNEAMLAASQKTGTFGR